MQSSYRQSTSPPHRNGSSFVITTNGQQSTAKTFSRQIQAQSSSSVEMMAKEKQELIMKLLMMSFQIQRKDVVVKSLLKQLQQMSTKNSISSSQQLYSMQQQLSKTKRYSQDLEFKINQLELMNKQISVNQKSNSRQMQERIVFLQTKNKQLEVKKIELQSEYQKLMTDAKMLNFKLVNTESTEKGKHRQMQNQIMNMERKIDEQKKIATQLKIIIDSLRQENRIVRENEQRMVRDHQDAIRSLSKQINHRQDLKRSQAVNSQQKIEMTQQQLIRMQDQVKFLRKKLDDQQNSYQRKEQQLLIDLKKAKDIQAQLFHTRHQNTVFKGQLDQKVHQVNNLIRQLNEVKSAYNQLQKSRQISEVENTQSFQQRVYLIQQQTDSYRQRVVSLQNELDHMKNENRRLKRKGANVGSGQCTSCKILQSATTIKSVKIINDLNLQDIIQQTQKLHNSNLKIQQILSSKRISLGVFDSRISIDNSYVYEG